METGDGCGLPARSLARLERCQDLCDQLRRGAPVDDHTPLGSAISSTAVATSSATTRTGVTPIGSAASGRRSCRTQYRNFAREMPWRVAKARCGSSLAWHCCTNVVIRRLTVDRVTADLRPQTAGRRDHVNTLSVERLHKSVFG